jgi:uncharacterized protein YlxW (UPF0749 family)
MWLKFKVWTKIGAICAAALYLLLFTYFNAGNTVTLWLFLGVERQGSVLWLGMTAFVAGALAVLLAKTVFGTLRQYRQLRQGQEQAKLQRDVAEMQQKAAMLQTRDANADKPAAGAKPEGGAP